GGRGGWVGGAAGAAIDAGARERCLRRNRKAHPRAAALEERVLGRLNNLQSLPTRPFGAGRNCGASTGRGANAGSRAFRSPLELVCCTRSAPAPKNRLAIFRPAPEGRGWGFTFAAPHGGVMQRTLIVAP